MTKSDKQPLKIGFVLDGGLQEPDGIQQYILSLGEHFKSLGHNVRYLVTGPINYGQEDAISLAKSYTIRSNGNKANVPLLPASSKKLKHILSTEGFDVLHVQAPYIPTFGERLVYLAGTDTALIGTFHEVPYHWLFIIGNFILGFWSRLSINRFDELVSVSSAAQRVAKRDFGVNSVIVPNMVDYARFKQAKPFLKRDNRITILFLGRLVKRKGCLDLLKAVAILKDKDLPKFKVIICGKGPLLSELKAFVLANGLEERIEFKGFVSEKLKPRYYASADISVFPAIGGESFGVVLIEAMASGRSAVIGADNEGYKSVLKEPGQLFKKKDPEDLAARLEELLLNKKLRLKYARSGCLYDAEFDVKVVGSRLLSIYRRALLKKRG